MHVHADTWVPTNTLQQTCASVQTRSSTANAGGAQAALKDRRRKVLVSYGTFGP